MASAAKIKWTEEAIRALGVRTDVPTAGEIIAGWHRDDAYDAVKRGEFPVPVVRCGRRLIVPVAPILALLRIRPAMTDSAQSEPLAADLAPFLDWPALAGETDIWCDKEICGSGAAYGPGIGVVHDGRALTPRRLLEGIKRHAEATEDKWANSR
jgi:hypothetical protein